MDYALPPVLETERLVLRPLTADDAKSAFVWLSDEKVNKFMQYNLYNSIDEVFVWINEIIPSGNEFMWGFEIKESGLLIGSGSIGPYENEDCSISNAWGFGYNIRSDYWNKGFATEATKRMIEFAHDEMNVKNFVSDHAIDNPASGRVIEKCGLIFDHFGEYSTFDNCQTFKAKYYSMKLK